MGLFSRLMGKRPDYKELMRRGVKVVDVRTPGEFRSGHIKPSVNLPLQEIDRWKGKFKNGEEVILVCKSGMRASMAKRVLKGGGIVAYNAGAWQNLM